ncbi:MAG TPA: hypothetical protein PLQ36_03120 [Candidatus Gracilibacteria bacterium]|nr:hypothetical protein [Candidatus Gracilibacteria bacterium]
MKKLKKRLLPYWKKWWIQAIVYFLAGFIVAAILSQTVLAPSSPGILADPVSESRE